MAEPVHAAASRCASSRRTASPSCKAVGAKLAVGARGDGHRDRPRPARALPAPLRRPHRAGRDRRARDRRGGDGRRRGASASTRAGRATASARSSSATSTTAPVCSSSCSSTRRGASGSCGRARRSRSSGRSSSYRGKRQMTNPVVDVLADPDAGPTSPATIVPVYPQSGKAEVHTLAAARARWRRACERTQGARLRRPARRRGCAPTHDLVDRTRAYRDIHRPETHGRPRTPPRTGSSSTSSCACSSRSSRASARWPPRRPGSSTRVDGALVPAVPRRAAVPAHRRPGRGDRRRSPTTWRRPAPMHRLLQGEVGSGKTVVALTALLTAVQGGYQGAFMAPDRGAGRAARAHHARRCSTSLIGARRGHAARRAAGAGRAAHQPHRARPSGAGSPTGCATGEVDIVVGTHALIYGERRVRPPRRRGDRRAAPLRRRAARPAAGEGRRARRARDDGDADPAHRGDAHLRRPRQDRAAPAARGPVADRHRRWSAAARWSASRSTSGCAREVAAGRQAYVVCPLVEGSDKLEAKAATEELERLARRGARRPAPRPAPRPDAGRREGGGDGARSAPARLDVLVATTVIEVGVDVPNATVMVVEDADRFGLLAAPPAARPRRARRARVVLLPPRRPDHAARARRGWRRWCESTDGFELAERDLEIRGAGEVFGERQAGWTDLKLGRLPRDEPIVVEARARGRADPRRRPRPRAARAARAKRSRTSSATRSSSSSRADESTAIGARCDGAATRRLRVIAGDAGGRRWSRRRAGSAPDDRPGQGVDVRRARARTGSSTRRCSTSTRAAARSAIEALSRGAARAVLVDRDAAAAVDACRAQPRDHAASTTGRRVQCGTVARVPGAAAAGRAPVRPRVPRPALRRPRGRGRGRCSSGLARRRVAAARRDRGRRAADGGAPRRAARRVGVPSGSGRTAIRS